MKNAWLALTLLVGAAVSASGCAAEVDLAKTLTVADVTSGWYDFGTVDGKNKLVPSIGFKVQNVGGAEIRRVLMLVSFWPQGADGDIESREIAVGADGIAPGGASESALIRASVGYTLDPPQARADLFTHSMFKDWTVKLFAKRAGQIVPLGEYTIERRIIPQTSASNIP